MPSAQHPREESGPGTCSELSVRTSDLRPKAPSSPLLAHLQSVSSQEAINSVVQLLADIRRQQQHSEMQRLLEGCSLPIIQGVRDTCADLLTLLVEDYQQAHDLSPDDECAESQKIELEIHVTSTVAGHLAEFRNVLETIRHQTAAVVPNVHSSDVSPCPQHGSENRKEYTRQLRYPQFETPAYNLTQVTRAIMAGANGDVGLSSSIRDNDRLRVVAARFLSVDGHLSAGLIDEYLAQKQSGHPLYNSFDAFLSAKLEEVKNACPAVEVFDRLLRWSPRQTLPAAAAPPPAGNSASPVSPMPDLRRTDPVPQFPDETEREESFDESALQRSEIPYVYRGKRHVVTSGSLTEMTYAMTGAAIQVEDGAKLILKLASDQVTVQLSGENSHVRIDRAGSTCQRLTIIGPDGHMLTESPLLELGEGVAEQLTIPRKV